MARNSEGHLVIEGVSTCVVEFRDRERQRKIVGRNLRIIVRTDGSVLRMVPVVPDQLPAISNPRSM